jgi:hypothetical protein
MFLNWLLDEYILLLLPVDYDISSLKKVKFYKNLINESGEIS